jgi:hypothetical protein
MSLSDLRPLACCLALASLLLAGCGKNQTTGTITGVVKVDGKPLPQGRVTFHSEHGEAGPRNADVLDGKYTLANFPTGPVSITVQSFPPARGQPKLPKGLNIPHPGDSTEPAKTVNRPFVPVPQIYGVKETTPEHYTVTEGTQTHDINISSKKQ